uniref:Uncharacterized protein n=1 Tax=Chromera velia CCMP2878 TaxID=1169474 RepID=A0A0G4G9I9_9ALVE|eukprot:Cvel_20908.t1-p1 / transcript=Cvel_20908.t1 / gene=Cvel_20908 / organism=Chromera_velia_CCMP2878 / gene_product=hypothetical protein / transcript_product=hypothetical protein / location=Cvel_scaffold1918:16411-19231(+) / protein_length=261 / sequence_SO=supercontig / SO=protein_coding / is_pseudo=false
MKQEYSLTLLAMQLAVQERVQVFPWLLNHRDRNGRVVIPRGVVLSFVKIDQRLEDLLLDSDDVEWEIADPAKVIMIVNALMDDQHMKLVNSLRSKLPGLGGQLDLRQIDYATLKKELEWFASFDQDAEIKARQRQSGGRERAFRGQQRRGRGSAASADDVDRFSDFDVDEDREVDVLTAGGVDPEAVVSSSKLQAIFPNSVPSAAVRQLDRIVRESVSSVSASVPFPPPFAAGSQLQAGHLELRSQQQGVGGGEEKEKQSG